MDLWCNGGNNNIRVRRTLCESSLEQSNYVSICFVDYENGFDRVNWMKLLGIKKKLMLIGETED